MIADTETDARARAFAIDDFGLALTGEPSLALLMEAFTEAVRAKNRSGWVMGDAYALAEDSGWSEGFSQALDPAMVSLRTVQNCASVCRAFPKHWRKVPLSMSHYASACKLVNTKPTAALALLAQAYDGGMDREWVRTTAKRLLGESETSIEVLLTWDGEHQTFIPNIHLDLPAGTTRTIHLKVAA